MNLVTIEPPPAPGTPGARAAAGLLELGEGSLLAYAAEIAEIAEIAEFSESAPIAALRHALEIERARIAGFLPFLAPEEIAYLLADLLTHALAAGGSPADASCVLALHKQGTVHLLASGDAAAYLASPGPTPVRRVVRGALSFLLPGLPTLPGTAASAPRPPLGTTAGRRFQPSEVIRLPIANDARVILSSGEIEPTLEERLLAALQSTRDPEALEPLLRGPVERTGGALVAYVAPVADTVDARDGVASEIAALRREVERRLARLDSRLKEVEDFALGRLASPGRARFALPGLPSLNRPRPALVRRPLPGSPEDLASADDAPAFERGLDVPVASNWSRPLLLVTGGVTLVLFLSIQLFCATVPKRRAIHPPPKAVPAAAAGKPGTPGAGAVQKPPVGVLLVTPSNEPEGTEGGAPPRR